jgi:serine/threonine protein kinase
LSSHPYIVTIFEAEVTDDGHSYLAMEYCSRPSLDVRYRRQRFSVDEVLAVGIQVASAVETAHRAGIAHRDIKPANILVTDYNRPALTDFGISGTIGADADDDAGMSIPWSPPEQFRGGNVNGVLVDVWALGATLYTLLAGRSPFVLPGQDNSQRELIARITNAPLPRLGRADLPDSLELVLATAMAKSPGSRYSSAHAFALALQRIQAELNLSVTPFEVLEEPHSDDGHPDDGVEETRVRSIVSIDPEARGTATTGTAPTFPGRTLPETDHGRSRAETTPASHTQQGLLDSASAGDSSSTILKGHGFVEATPVSGPAAPQAPEDRTVLRSAGHLGPHGPAAPAHGPAAPAPAADDTEFAATTIGRSPEAWSDGAQSDAEESPADHRTRNIWLAAIGAAVLLVAVVAGIVLGTQGTPKVQETQQVSRPPADALDSGNVPDVTITSYKSANKVVFFWSNPQEEFGDTYKWRVKTAKDNGTFTSTQISQVEVNPNPSEPTCIQVILVRADGRASPGGEGSINCLAAE